MVSKRYSLPVAISLLLVATGCDDKKQGGQPAPGPVEVTVVTVAPRTVDLFTDLPGRTVAYRVAEVRPQVSGIVQKRLFEEGREVKAGQQLYQIDPATYQAAVRSAEADLAKARATLKSVEAKAERYADLVRINAVSRQDYDDAVASLDQAKAEIMVAKAALDTARINLDYTRVYASIAGRISKSSVTEGALVTANQTSAMATITQLDPIYVDVNQSSSELMRLRQAVSAGLVQKGQADQAPVTLTLDGAKNSYALTGQLQFSDVTVDQGTGTVHVRAVFPNPRKELYPGLFVRARVEQGTRANAMVVPQKALVRNPDGSSAVWVVNPDDTVSTRSVTPSQAVGESWLIDSGLSGGERVVTEGILKVRTGAKVRPVEAVPAAAPAAPPSGPAAGQH